MALSLFNGQLLVADGPNVKIRIELGDGIILPVTIARHGFSSGNPGSDLRFQTTYGSLPEEAQVWFKERADANQKRISEESPTLVRADGYVGGGLLRTRDHRGRQVNSRGKRITPKPPKYKTVPKPPETVGEIGKDRAITLQPHSRYNNFPALELGKPFMIKFGEGWLASSHTVGHIVSFKLTPPASR